MYSTIIDISWPLTQDVTCYKDRRCIDIQETKNFSRDQVRETQLTLGSHVGTHIDAPSHFLHQGYTIDQMSLQQCIGPCTVIDLTECLEKITSRDLEQYSILKNDIVLLKTKNSMCLATDEFNYNFIYLDESGARYLAKKNIKSVGIDYLGIERNQPNHETHTQLMDANITIIEGLRLAAVDAGRYMLIVLPLAIVGTEAAPARAILMK